MEMTQRRGQNLIEKHNPRTFFFLTFKGHSPLVYASRFDVTNNNLHTITSTIYQTSNVLPFT